MKPKRTNILGIDFDVVTQAQALEIAMGFLQKTPKKDNNKLSIIFTPAPEIVMKARKSEEFRKIINSADLIIPDGIGIVFASKLNKIKISERVTGIDLVSAIMSEMSNSDCGGVYFFGGAPGVAEAAAVNLKKEYPNLNIVGVRDGYFEDKDEESIINEINSSGADLLLVGLGCPKQENWIFRNKKRVNVRLAVGVGGSFDVWGGKVKRAPKVFIKLNLEWLYRLLRQPSRIGRQLQLVVFAFAVLKSKIFGKGRQKA